MDKTRTDRLPFDLNHLAKVVLHSAGAEGRGGARPTHPRPASSASAKRQPASHCQACGDSCSSTSAVAKVAVAKVAVQSTQPQPEQPGSNPGGPLPSQQCPRLAWQCPGCTRVAALLEPSHAKHAQRHRTTKDSTAQHRSDALQHHRRNRCGAAAPFPFPGLVPPGVTAPVGVSPAKVWPVLVYPVLTHPA